MPKFIESIQTSYVDGFPVGVIRFTEPMEVLSSAVLNGGVSETEAAFIMEVPKDYDHGDYIVMLNRVRGALGLPDNSVGMMTAAEVDKVFNVKISYHNGVEVTAFSTAGLANHVIAGEELTDYDEKAEVSIRRMNVLRPGTINIGVICPVPLTMEAKVNLTIPITEAKTVAMFRQGFLETGTTSDSIAIFCPKGEDRAKWTGTGSDIGIATARAVADAVGWALRRRDEHPSPFSPDEIFRRCGYSRDMMYSISGTKAGPERFQRKLEDLMSGNDVSTIMDMAYAISFRADSRGNDGHPEYPKRIKTAISKLLDVELRDGDLMDSIIHAIAVKAGKGL